MWPKRRGHIDSHSTAALVSYLIILGFVVQCESMVFIQSMVSNTIKILDVSEEVFVTQNLVQELYFLDDILF